MSKIVIIGAGAMGSAFALPCFDNNPDSNIDLSSDGWVSINDILIEEGHAYDYHGGKKKDFKKEIQKEKEESKLVKGNKDD